VSGLEIQTWLSMHGKTIPILQADKIVELIDFDQNGRIDYEDFLVVITARILSKKFEENLMK
jgi:Ca2+-binding EF-hand superfamily protein